MKKPVLGFFCGIPNRDCLQGKHQNMKTNSGGWAFAAIVGLIDQCGDTLFFFQGVMWWMR